jgi:hypothetical protein
LSKNKKPSEKAVEVPRREIDFEPLARESVEAIERIVKRHHPDAELEFYDCGNCQLLHIVGPEECGVMLDISPTLWKRKRFN